MKCISCETEINPQWKHAIDMNVCPFCGKHIMEEHLKNLFSTLRETMDALQSYPAQLNDWMLSNHNYVKTDSPDIGQYMPKGMLQEIKKMEEEKAFQAKKESQGKKEIIKIKNADGEEEEVVVQKIQSEDRTNEFFKRAEVLKTPHADKPKTPNATPVFNSLAEKTAHHKSMVQQIKKEGSKGLVSEGGGSMMLPASMIADADPEAIAEFQQMISGGEVSSSLEDSWDGDDDLPGGDGILAANRAVAAAKQGGSSDGTYNAKDAAHLARLQEKVSESRKNMKGGGGSFSRS